MFFARLLPGVRLFSSSAILQFPKLKSHNGAKKRWRSIANGRFKRARAGRVHLNIHQSPSRTNALGKTAISHGSQTVRLKKLLPYGSP